jgi:putative membrane protein
MALVVIAAISWQGYQNLGFQHWLMAVGGAVVLVLLGSLVSWSVSGYHVVGRELRIYEGLLFRRTRAIPLERVQSIELVRPVLARAFGLADLRLEVVGAAKTEAPLAFLTVDEATALRERLLAISRSARPGATGTGTSTATGTGTGTQPAAPPALVGGVIPTATQPEQRLHVINNRDLVVSQLLRPQWWFLPLAIVVPIVLFATSDNVGFFALASTVTAVIGAVQAPVRAVLGDWRFTLARAADGLRIHRGLLETRSQTVPPGRVQTVAVEWPLLWRGSGWVRVQMHIAGASTGDGGQERAGLLPVGQVAVAAATIAEVIPGFVLTDVAMIPLPDRARWLVPLRKRVLGYQLTDTAFVTRDGLLTRRLVIVGYGRIQSVRVRQGPIQRLLRLASVWVDSAGGGFEAVALHRDVPEALALATALADRSRAARHVDRGFLATGSGGNESTID